MLSRRAFFMVIPLVLSGFTHLWNPIGFPDFFSDEGVYLRRALHVLEGLGPQETETYYDHPFFGQIFLSAIFFLIGYPNYLHSSNAYSTEMLFTVPRIIMGLLAVIDTFLIFKIAERQYNYKVALIASVLFAVMPMSWFMRRILLENLQLPFLLSSILLALNLKSETGNSEVNKETKRNTIYVLISGIFLGLAIFTKIPVFVMMPLVAFLIIKYAKNKRNLALWLIPVLLIPAIWPLYSVVVGQFGYWLDTIKLQSTREGDPLLSTIPVLLHIDPVLIIVGTAGLIIAIVKKDPFILFYAIPIFAFICIVSWNWAPYQLFITLVPLFCISAAKLIFDISNRFNIRNIAKSLPWITITVIGIFGLVSTSMLITTNITGGQIQVIKFVISYLKDNPDMTKNTMIVSNPIYSWIFIYPYYMNNLTVLNEVNDFDYENIKADRILFISDVETEGVRTHSQRLQTLFNTTFRIFKVNGIAYGFDSTIYPFTSMIENYESLEPTEIRVCTSTCVHYD
jgi:hypothetical protein